MVVCQEIRRSRRSRRDQNWHKMTAESKSLSKELPQHYAKSFAEQVAVLGEFHTQWIWVGIISLQRCFESKRFLQFYLTVCVCVCRFADFSPIAVHVPRSSKESVVFLGKARGVWSMCGLVVSFWFAGAVDVTSSFHSLLEPQNYQE